MSVISAPQSHIFWAEADDGVGTVLTGADQSLARRSLAAYLLLRRPIVIHPAYLWQSDTANTLIFHPSAQTIVQSSVQLILGDSPTVSDYMTDRIAKLSRDRASSAMATELDQYTRHTAALGAQATHLDNLLTQSGKKYAGVGSRDDRFRKLVRADLTDTSPFGPHLYALIRQQLIAATADSVIKTLTELTYSKKRFISIDGVLGRLADAGIPRARLGMIHTRLQLLHWQAHSQVGLQIPLLSRVQDGRLDPCDPDIFWGSMNGLVGDELEEVILKLPWDRAISVLNDLRADPLWGKLVETYHGLVDVVNREHNEIREELVRKALLKEYPGFLSLSWKNRPDTLTLVSLACTIGTWSLGIPAGLALAFRSVSTTISVYKLFGNAKKIVDAYYSSDRKQIGARMRETLTSAKGR